MRQSIFFYKELTPAEVGKTGTHEVYVRLPNNFDYESFFGNSATMNGSVLEVNFVAQDITDGGSDSVSLRFVFFKNSNLEKRIPSLGSLFKIHNVQEGDVVCLESRIDGTSTTYRICFYKKGEVQVNPASVYFSRIERDYLDTSKNNRNYQSLQQIFYGAPGTGKSHTIQERTEHEDVIRTTFHPDTDYSTFVGAYKPTTIDAPVMTVIGTKAVPVENEDGSPRIEPKIIYEFVNQAFLQAYVKAWEKYCEGGFDNAQKQFLVIEEINRGNCAQIFGDLFQLLDRNDAGFSDYPIKADADMAKQLKKQLKDLTIEDPDAINSLYKGENIVSQVLNGELLLLPKNLYIWATMNTSDQSLFPIDSAFKRRWDWEYIPIANANKNWKIKVAGKRYDWWDFLNNINDIVEAATSSEDKKLGYFFVKADDENNISAEKFVSKVVFYLWNDVFKDYGFDWKNKEGKPVFKDEQGNDLTFKKFFYPDGSVIETIVAVLLDNLLVSTEEEVEAEDPAAPAINGAHKHLRSVAFTDGIVFDSNNTKSHFEIYLETIKKIGVEWAAPLIENMGYRRLDSPLVTRIKYPELENSDTYSYLKVEDFYFVKGGNDDTLIAVLEGLNKQLTDKITINYV